MSDDISAEELSLSLIPAVEQQLESSETPFVKEHFDRLIQEDEIDEHEAKKMIALCLADEVETMQKEQRSFNLPRYQQMVQFLPLLPE